MRRRITAPTNEGFRVALGPCHRPVSDSALRKPSFTGTLREVRCAYWHSRIRRRDATWPDGGPCGRWPANSPGRQSPTSSQRGVRQRRILLRLREPAAGQARGSKLGRGSFKRTAASRGSPKPPEAGFPASDLFFSSLSPRLMRQIALECGYGGQRARTFIAVASDGEPMARILIYTGVRR